MATSPNEKLRRAILEHVGGYETAAKVTGASERTLKRATTEGATIKSEYLIPLFDKFGIRPGSILEPTYDNYVIYGEEDDEAFTQILFYPKVRASAGHGLIAENEESLPIQFRTYFIKNTLNASPKDLIAIKASGESMYPDIRDGDLLLVDMSQDSVRSERPYLVVLTEQVMVKYVRSFGQGRYKLISKDPTYGDQDVSKGDQFRILGEVRHIQRTI